MGRIRAVKGSRYLTNESIIIIAVEKSNKSLSSLKQPLEMREDQKRLLEVWTNTRSLPMFCVVQYWIIPSQLPKKDIFLSPIATIASIIIFQESSYTKLMCSVSSITFVRLMALLWCKPSNQLISNEGRSISIHLYFPLTFSYFNKGIQQLCDTWVYTHTYASSYR